MCKFFLLVFSWIKKAGHFMSKSNTEWDEIRQKRGFFSEVHLGTEEEANVSGRK